MSGENFDNMTEELHADYLDRYEGVQMQINYVNQFDDSQAVSTTYLDKPDRSRKDNIKVEEHFSVTDQSITVGTLLSSIECKMLLDSSATKSFISNNTILEINSFVDYQSSVQKQMLCKLEMDKELTICSFIP